MIIITIKKGQYDILYRCLYCYSAPKKLTYSMSINIWYLCYEIWQSGSMSVYCRGRGKANHNRLVEEEKHSTFFQLRPKLPYDIFHQKGAALPVAPNMLLSWLLTKRECSGECDEGVKLCCVKLCGSYTVLCEASSRLTYTCNHTESNSESWRVLIKLI